MMAAERGSAFLLKIGDGTATPTYATVAGLKTTQLSINGDAVVITNKGSAGWRELLSGAGVRSVSVAASGIFTGSSAETSVRSLALSGSLQDYELSFEGGDRMRGKFLVTRLEYAGDFNGERNYTLALESSGQVAAL
jgi:TP901-1 family phage major tail protein